jgi:hypothetical protein
LPLMVLLLLLKLKLLFAFLIFLIEQKLMVASLPDRLDRTLYNWTRGLPSTPNTWTRPSLTRKQWGIQLVTYSRVRRQNAWRVHVGSTYS